ncbi:HK97 gp10 family phage protein [Sphingomonas sp. C8-2]|nr:HK97 gp10 family phage protein [Sphingomonas sp. C8-2]
MATARGRADVKRFILEQTPQDLRKVLIGAGRAGGNVVADDARERCKSNRVRNSIKVKVKAGDSKVVTSIQTSGPGSAEAGWLEYGTEAHFISVDDSQRGGRSIRKINEADKAARRAGKIGGAESLVINGQFVGDTVRHPGARPEPFLRPALDTKENEAVAAAQAHINNHVTPAGVIVAGAEGVDR